MSLNTSPPHLSHGSGVTLDASHDVAALTALRALAELGYDSLTNAAAAAAAATAVSAAAAAATPEKDSMASGDG